MRLRHVLALTLVAGSVLWVVFFLSGESATERVSSERVAVTDRAPGVEPGDSASRAASGPLRVVVVRQGRPVSGAKVYVDGGFRGATGSNGLALEGAHRGVMHIHATHREWRGAARSVARAGAVTVRLAHLAWNQLGGTVVDSNGDPLHGVLVRTATDESRTDTGGRFVLPTAQRGGHRVRVLLDGVLIAVREVWVGIHAELVVRPPLTVGLVVETTEGEPLEARVAGAGRLAGAYPFSLPAVDTGEPARGTVRLLNPRDSSIAVVARADGYVPKSVDLVAGKLNEGQTIRVVLETGRPLTLFIDDPIYVGRALWVRVGRHSAGSQVIDPDDRARFDGQPEGVCSST